MTLPTKVLKNEVVIEVILNSQFGHFLKSVYVPLTNVHATVTYRLAIISDGHLFPTAYVYMYTIIVHSIVKPINYIKIILL